MISWLRETIGRHFPETEFDVSVPPETKLGDYSTNIAFGLAKKEKKNPKEVAEEVIAKLLDDSEVTDKIEKMEFAPPGFINFFLKLETLQNTLEDISQNENYGLNNDENGKTVMVEHTQPNPFKDFHIGHLMNNSIGESVARIIKANGAEVKTATYHGDVGLHVAKSVWAIQKNNYDASIASMSKAYAEGNQAYEEDEAAKKEIIEINKKIYDRSDERINKIYDTGRKTSFDYFESLYKRLGSHFDFHFYESEAGEIGKTIVLEFLDKGVFKESQGAVVFEGERFGFHTRVFLSSEKLPTYETKEVGLAKIKKEKCAYGKSITITANEQDSFFDVVEIAIGEVFPELRGKLRHLSHGILKLPSGKMSSRTGTVILAEALIGQVKLKVLDKIKDREFDEGEKENIAEVVALGAIKYSILKQGIGSDIVFDFDKSISFEGDSGPYLQYTYARLASILHKSTDKFSAERADLLEEPEERAVMCQLVDFPEVIKRAGELYAPSEIALYVHQLADKANRFYERVHILKDENPERRAARLALVRGAMTVLRKGLNALGIQTLERI